MNTANATEILHNSLARCNTNPAFLRIFYEHLLDISPEIKAMFGDSNMESHIKIVQKSLETMASVANNEQSSMEYLQEIAEKHKSMRLKPEYFKFWEISLLATIAKCDPEYDEKIRRAWKDMLSKGINFLVNYK